MTDNHGYNTPTAGEEDWHIPINGNFEKLDVDSEIRDASGNLGNYQPKQGAKFLAIDTGEVYLGDGSSWTLLGEIAPSGGGTTAAGEIVAERGSVQSALESASSPADWSNNTYQTVKLRSGEIYEPQSTWSVGPRVAFNGNGALIKPNHGGTVLDVAPVTELRNVRIDARATGWPRSNSTPMVHMDSGLASTSGASGWRNGIPTYNCYFAGPPGSGKGLLIEDSAAKGMGGFPLHVSLSGFTTQLHLKATSGSSAWVNGIKGHIRLRNYDIGIKQEQSQGAASSGNYFYAVGNQATKNARWLWDVGRYVGQNALVGPIWDTRFLQDETAVRFQQDTWNNVIVDTQGFLADWQVVNNGDSTNGVGRWNDQRFQRNQ